MIQALLSVRPSLWWYLAQIQLSSSGKPARRAALEVYTLMAAMLAFVSTLFGMVSHVHSHGSEAFPGLTETSLVPIAIEAARYAVKRHAQLVELRARQGVSWNTYWDVLRVLYQAGGLCREVLSEQKGQGTMARVIIERL